MKANKIAASGIIYADQELTIPNVPAKKITVVEKSDTVKIGAVAPTTGVKVASTEVKTSIETGSYTTKRGDSYWNIAVRAYGDGYSWTKIYEANKKIFGHANMIHADVKITIPSLK